MTKVLLLRCAHRADRVGRLCACEAHGQAAGEARRRASAAPAEAPSSLPKIEPALHVSTRPAAAIRSSVCSAAARTTKTAAARASGLAGLLIGEVTVKGVLRDRSGFIAMLQAPDNKTYNVRVGDKLIDGSVKSINQEQGDLFAGRQRPAVARQATGGAEAGPAGRRTWVMFRKSRHDDRD